MMSVPHLSPRLRFVASLVRPGGVVADIGTDHGYLPVWLVNSGHNPRAVAGDVREGPLDAARRTVEHYQAGERVRLVLSDGLDGIDHADDVVIAGMGGELTAELLARCAFVRDASVQLVLQPMTAVGELRLWLCRGGFTIRQEGVVREGGRLYVAMTAVYTGDPFEPDRLFPYTGTLTGRDGDEREYLRRQAARLWKRAAGLRASARRAAEAEPVEELARAVSARAGLPGAAADDSRGLSAERKDG